MMMRMCFSKAFDIVYHRQTEATGASWQSPQVNLAILIIWADASGNSWFVYLKQDIQYSDTSKAHKLTLTVSPRCLENILSKCSFVGFCVCFLLASRDSRIWFNVLLQRNVTSSNKALHHLITLGVCVPGGLLCNTNTVFLLLTLRLSQDKAKHLATEWLLQCFLWDLKTG